MIQIRKDGRFDRTVHVTAGDQFVLWVDGKEVHRTDIGRVMQITYWACIEIGENGVGYVIGDDQTEADLKKMAAVQWTDRDLIEGVFNDLRDRMPFPSGPGRMGL